MPARMMMTSVVAIAIAAVSMAARPAPVNAAGADAPGVRAAVFYSIDPPGVVRSKGVDKVTNPKTGLYCVKLKAGKIKNARKTAPVISVESETSKGSGAQVTAAVGTGSDDCPKNKRWIVVRTLVWWI